MPRDIGSSEQDLHHFAIERTGWDLVDLRLSEVNQSVWHHNSCERKAYLQLGTRRTVDVANGSWVGERQLIRTNTNDVATAAVYIDIELLLSNSYSVPKPPRVGERSQNGAIELVQTSRVSRVDDEGDDERCESSRVVQKHDPIWDQVGEGQFEV